MGKFDMDNFMATYQPLATLSIATCVTMAIAVLPGIYTKQLFSWHPLLMTLGFLGFMREGLLAAHRFRQLEGQPRVAAIQNHMWVQVSSLVCILLGFFAIYGNKVIMGKEHFTSLHGKVGLLTLLALLANICLGALSFRKLGFINHVPQEMQPRLKWLHRLAGVVVWALGIVCMQLDLPHPAVFEGFICRMWQLAVLALGAGMLMLLRTHGRGKSALPQLYSSMSGGNLVAIPQGPKHL